MALVQPSIVLPIPAVIKGRTATINFNFGLGSINIAQSSKISIYEYPNDSSPLVTSVYNSTTNQHIISSVETDKLTTEKEYYMSIQTYTGTDATGESSAESIRSAFWVLDTPLMSILAPAENTVVAVNTLYVEATYNTGIVNDIAVDNKPSYYSFELIQNDNIIFTSNYIIGEGDKKTNTDYSLSYTFNGLTNGRYILRVNAVSTQGMKISVERNIEISTQIIAFKTATAINNKCEGYVTVECNITDIKGQSNGIVNEDEGWLQLVDLPEGIEGYITWDDGYNFPSASVGKNLFSNWTLQLWEFNFRPTSRVPDSVTNLSPTGLRLDKSYIIQLRTLNETKDVTSGEIDVYIVYDTSKQYIRADMYVYPFASAKGYGVSKYIPSNSIQIPDEGSTLSTADNLTIWIRSLNGEYDIKLRNITKNEPPYA